MLRFSFFICLLLIASPSSAETLYGHVISVADGDTITILANRRKQLKVRLSGIDAPERKQAYGSKAKYVLSELVYGKEVRIETETIDRYGRTVGYVFDASGRNINELMVEKGYAWWYRTHAPESHSLQQKELRARQKSRGLWHDEGPTPPWEFRYTGGPELRTLFDNKIIIGNRRSKIYHTPGCSTYARVSPQNRKRFSSAAEAEKAGYRKAKNCN